MTSELLVPRQLEFHHLKTLRAGTDPAILPVFGTLMIRVFQIPGVMPCPGHADDFRECISLRLLAHILRKWLDPTITIFSGGSWSPELLGALLPSGSGEDITSNAVAEDTAILDNRNTKPRPGVAVLGGHDMK